MEGVCEGSSQPGLPKVRGLTVTYVSDSQE